VDTNPFLWRGVWGRWRLHWVFLRGLNENGGDREGCVDSFNKEAVCMIKYDQIVTCDDRGPMIPDAVASAVASAVEEAVANEVALQEAATEAANRNQGGRRSRRSKSKKRKTRRTKRRV